MPQMFVVDQTQTFAHVMALSAEPRVKFGTSDQECTKDGVPKWTVQCAAGFRSFGKVENEILKVTVAAQSDPVGELTGQAVQLLGLQVGVMDRQIKDKDTGEMKTGGAQVYYRADEVRSLAATGPRSSGKQREEAA